MHNQAPVSQQTVLGLAASEATKAGGAAFILVGGLTWLAALKSPKFNKYLSISAKTSLPVMAGLFVFSIRFEHVSHDAKMHPSKYHLWEREVSQDSSRADREVVKVKGPSLSIFKKTMNALYDHPFRLVGLLSVPVVGLVLRDQLKMGHLSVSQRLMQSKVVAQFGVVGILLATMFFVEAMNQAGGRFETDSEASTPDNGVSPLPASHSAKLQQEQTHSHGAVIPVMEGRCSGAEIADSGAVDEQ